MLKAAIILSILSYAFATANLNNSLPRLDGRIVGGSDGRISDFPYQVSLQRFGSHICGGSIYSHNIIITAAHCVQNTEASYLTVRAGSTFSDFGGVIVAVAAYKIHEGYNPNTIENDIAVLRLKSSLAFGSTITSINLVQNPPENGAPAVVSGWGSTSPWMKAPITLQYVKVNIVRDVLCSSALYGYGDGVKSSMICAAAEGKDSCQGDSGGPLVSGGVLVGVVSWGYGCARPNYPGVYSCVAALRSWIEDSARKI